MPQIADAPRAVAVLSKCFCDGHFCTDSRVICCSVLRRIWYMKVILLLSTRNQVKVRKLWIMSFSMLLTVCTLTCYSHCVSSSGSFHAWGIITSEGMQREVIPSVQYLSFTLILSIWTYRLLWTCIMHITEPQIRMHSMHCIHTIHILHRDIGASFVCTKFDGTPNILVNIDLQPSLYAWLLK